MDIALDCFRARIAMACLFSAAVMPVSDASLEENVDFCSICLSTDWTRRMSQGGGLFLRRVYTTSFSFRLRLTDQRL